MLTSLILTLVLFEPSQTLKWECEPWVFQGREIYGFWMWDDDIHDICAATTVMSWEECLNEHAAWLPCYVWSFIDDCAPQSPPDECFPVSIEQWMCPGTHFGASPIKHFTHLSNVTVWVHVGVKGTCTSINDGTSPIELSWPLVCEGVTNEDFKTCCLILGGCD